MVAAAIADRRVGIDIEQIKPRGHEGLWERVASDQEWSLCGGRGWEMFFRLWTAKEATLKANGKGIGGLSDCRIVEVSDDRHIKLHYAGEDWRIEQYRHDDHIASVTMSGESIEWQVAKL
jgi:4'-phosphopantetheinyl transferase